MNKQEVRFVFVWSGSEFWSQIFKTEIKKSKTYSGWCPFQGLSNGNGTTLMHIQSGQTAIKNNLLNSFIDKKCKNIKEEKKIDKETCFISTADLTKGRFHVISYYTGHIRIFKDWI